MSEKTDCELHQCKMVQPDGTCGAGKKLVGGKYCPMQYTARLLWKVK